MWAGPLAGLACAGLTVSASELVAVKEELSNGASAQGALFVGRGGVRRGGQVENSEEEKETGLKCKSKRSRQEGRKLIEFSISNRM